MRRLLLYLRFALVRRQPRYFFERADARRVSLPAQLPPCDFSNIALAAELQKFARFPETGSVFTGKTPR